MLKYSVRRLLYAVPVIIGVSLVSFLLLHLTGDPVDLMVSTDAPPQVRQEMRVALGLDKSIIEQYLRFLGGAVRFDFGRSLFQSSQSAMGVVLGALPNTLLLSVSAFILALLLAFPIGFVSAVKRNTWLDRLGMLFALLGQSVPVFLLGTLFVWLFALQLGWLPTDGMYDSRGLGQNDFWDVPRHLLLPSLTLSLFTSARLVRLIRSNVIEVLAQDYIRTAQAKGLSYLGVLYRHVLKNTLIPIVTVLGLDFATLISGAVVTENIFSWPGVGRVAVEAINQHDFPVVQASVFLVALGYILINLAVDLLYAYLNPRIKFS